MKFSYGFTSELTEKGWIHLRPTRIVVAFLTCTLLQIINLRKTIRVKRTLLLARLKCTATRRKVRKRQKIISWLVDLPLKALGNVIINNKLETSGRTSSSENMAGAGRGKDEIMV